MLFFFFLSKTSLIVSHFFFINYIFIIQFLASRINEHYLFLYFFKYLTILEPGGAFLAFKLNLSFFPIEIKKPDVIQGFKF